ncbi:RDD family protein [Nocardioides sp. J2M5]|uniref:RDD family protein n=1 Tax=Nocardioides palaemonis TaxID=2829810 RepID=UPI001BA7B422|nr:RDD family protein [Nocardioides palaemonis]MBS2939454.1 RDD family protein [Nocardioides palaemonis]
MSAPTLPIDGPLHASLGRRLAANLVDALATAAVVYVVPLLLLLAVPATASMLVASLWMLVASVVWSLVQWRWLATTGQSFGKRRLGVWVLDATTGAPVGWARIFVRNLVLGLASMFLLPVVVMALTMQGDPRRQGWHDTAAATVVVTRPPAAASYSRDGAGATARTTERPAPSPSPAVAPPSLATGYATAAPPSGPSSEAPVGVVAPTPPTPDPRQQIQVSSGAPAAPPGTLVSPPPGWEPRPAPVVDHTVAAPAPSPTAPSPATAYVLRSSDGSTSLEVRSAPLVLGRAPETSAVLGGVAQVVNDPTRSMSKTHARVEVRDHRLHVEDLDSTNGVWVRAADGERRLATRTPTVVHPGDVVAFGDCSFVVESLA